MISDIRVIEIPQAVSTILNNDPTLSYDAATGKFYRFVNAGVGWNAALAGATSSQLNGVNGQLLVVESQYENDLMYAEALRADINIWLGMTDQTSEGQWFQLDGSNDGELFWSGTASGSAQNGNYANWHLANGQPNDTGGGQDHAQLMHNVGGQWDDAIESTANAYVIEWDASEVLYPTFTFSLTDDAGGRFLRFDSSTGEITVADGSLIDYETATSHNVTVEVTDAAGN